MVGLIIIVLWLIDEILHYFSSPFLPYYAHIIRILILVFSSCATFATCFGTYFVCIWFVGMVLYEVYSYLIYLFGIK